MWLLSTARAELHYFSTVEAAQEEGYAILSHVWDKNEQSFQDTKALQLRYADTGSNPRDHSSHKVQQSCMLAESHGYHWIWNDTCCIDKTSSAELSEAINSMFTYYSRALICYAYLRDIQNVLEDGQFEMELRKSVWFTRGWTLQELIAPDHLVFVTQDWGVVGTKADFADAITKITSIPAEVLRLEQDVFKYGVARRMSWAAKRKTTRPEDEAYCLMGIFDVNMPTLYGEGSKAFQRLQEEIMRKTIDTSLFAWGEPVMVTGSHLFAPSPHSEHQIYPEKYVFAPSPASFEQCGDTNFIPDVLTRHSYRPRGGGSPLEPGIPSFTLTPYGVRARIPLIEVTQDITLAIIFAHDGKYSLCMVLGRCPSSQSPDPRRELYHCCMEFCGRPLRLVYPNLILPDVVNMSWRDIYLTHQPPPSRPAPPLLMNRGFNTPFRVDEKSRVELLNEGFRILQPSDLPFPWSGDPPVTLTIVSRRYEDVEVRFGLCTVTADANHLGEADGDSASFSSNESVQWQPHWARISCTPRWKRRPTADANPSHDCASDHIQTGVNWARSIPLVYDIRYQKSLLPKDRTVNKSFRMTLAPYPLHPETTYIVRLHVFNHES